MYIFVEDNSAVSFIESPRAGFLQCSSAGQYSSVQCSTVQNSAIHYNTVQYSAAQRITVKRSAVQYIDLHFSVECRGSRDLCNKAS